MIAVSGTGLLNRYRTSQSDVTSVPSSQPDDAWFRAEHYLGQQGHRYLTPACCYGLAATQLALDDAAIRKDELCDEEFGVVVGTNFANYSTIENIDATIRRVGARGIRPMSAPNFSINVAASHISIRYGFKAFNITLTNPLVAGIESVIAGATAITSKRATVVATGALEDRAPARICAELGINESEPGAAILILEDLKDVLKRGGRPHVVLRGGASFSVSRSIEPGELDHVVARNVSRVLGNLHLPANRKIHLSSIAFPIGFSQRLGASIERAVSLQYDIETVSSIGIDGRFMTVSPLLALCDIAASHENGLIVTIGPFGQISLLAISKSICESSY